MPSLPSPKLLQIQRRALRASARALEHPERGLLRTMAERDPLAPGVESVSYQSLSSSGGGSGSHNDLDQMDAAPTLMDSSLDEHLQDLDNMLESSHAELRQHKALEPSEPSEPSKPPIAQTEAQAAPPVADGAAAAATEEDGVKSEAVRPSALRRGAWRDEPTNQLAPASRNPHLAVSPPPPPPPPSHHPSQA